MTRQRFLLILLAPMALSACAWFGAKDSQEHVTLVASDGSRHEFEVEVMRKPEELWRGLRWRTELAADHGMLFDLGEVREANFTMSDTLIPLDMLFIASDGRIVTLHARTVPGNPGPYSSDGPVRAVLELNAGTSEQLKVGVGDRVENEIFAPDVPR